MTELERIAILISELNMGDPTEHIKLLCYQNRILEIRKALIERQLHRLLEKHPPPDEL